MKLHDPDTEKELIRIARRVVGPEGFLKPDFSVWSSLFGKAITCVWMSYMITILRSLLIGETGNIDLRHAAFAILLMALVLFGQGRIATCFHSAGFFGALANLPISSHKALTHIRGIIIRRLWFVSLIVPFASAICLHYPVDPEKSFHVLTTWLLLSAIVWATLGIGQLGWILRLRLPRIWFWAACFHVAQIILFHYFDVRSSIPQAVLTVIDHVTGTTLWIFPPAWAFPEMAAAGGLIPAILWIAWGLWCWIRWPSTAFPAYDRPHDFVGAFGDVGISEETIESERPHASEEEEESIALEPPPQPPSTGWVERLIAATLPASDRVVAGVFLSESRHGRRVSLTIIFAALWMLALYFGKSLFHKELFFILLMLLSWIVPTVVFFLVLLPLGNPMKAALQPCPVGSTPVPIFTMLPVTIRSLLRITLRIVIVRTVIAVAIAIPFFWLLAKILELREAGAIIALILSVGLAWTLSVPAILANQMDPHLGRRRGIFPLILATSRVQVPIGFLWIIGSVAGVGLSIAWSMENDMGRYAFLLLPAAIGCFALSAVMSWLIFEILHLSLRQRRYEWRSKIR